MIVVSRERKLKGFFKNLTINRFGEKGGGEVDLTFEFFAMFL